jgi:hypothetical protein
MAVFTAPCKADDGEKVTYDPESPEGTVWGTETVKSQDVDVPYPPGTTTKTVYLECPKGHVYPYDVPV